MRREIKKRLEKALTTLQEPGGSTIRSIIKVINKDSPILSLRKVLEALQEGLNEGFLCMYNGRFKLKDQVRGFPRDRNLSDGKKDDKELGDDVEIIDSEADSEEEIDGNIKLPKDVVTFKGCCVKKKPRCPRRRRRRRCHKKRSRTRRRKRGCKGKVRRRRRRSKKMHCQKDSEKMGGDSVFEITSPYPEKKTGRGAAEKGSEPKRGRGPRCTSMKKDVRMPSKVHIPFVPPAVPQHSATFNDLLRRSPEPVNGPLFDSFLLSADRPRFFDFC